VSQRKPPARGLYDRIQGMFYILYGQDDFSLWQVVAEIKAGLGDPQMLAINTTRLDGQHLTLNELKDNCNTAPFLSPYRLVIVDGLLERFEPKWGKQWSGKRAVTTSQSVLGEWKSLGPCIEQMPQTTILVLIDGKIGGNNPLLKKLAPLAKVRTFPLLRGGRLIAWIRQQVVEEGGSITPQAVKLLAELVGGNLWTMNNEITKLLLYTQGRSITEDDVRQLTDYAQEVNIFALVDAVVEEQVEKAQLALHRLYQEGVSPTHILAMITRQFRLIAQARELGSGLSRRQIQDKLALKDYPLDKTLRQARLYDLERIKRAYAKLLETDLAIKTGKYSDQLAIEILVSELATTQFKVTQS
jgi:DNA polymerase III subunit delta